MRISHWLVLPLLPLAGVAANLIENPSFENADPSGKPQGWYVYRQNEANATLKSIPCPDAVDGKRVLRIENKTAFTADVYGAAVTSAKVEPGVRYRLTLQVRGKRLHSVQLALGKQWDLRFPINEPEEKFRRYTFEFTPRADQLDAEGRLPIIVLTDNITAATEIDDLQLIAANQPLTVGTVLEPARRNAAKLYLTAPHGTPSDQWPIMELPADAAHWSGKLLPSAADLRARAAFQWGDEGIEFVIHVTDDVVRVEPGNDMWRGDSIQLRLEPGALRLNEALDDDLEFGFSVSNDGRVNSWRWDQARSLTADEATLDGRCTKEGYEITGTLRWSLFPAKQKERGMLSFNWIVNDSDAPEHREVAFLAPGIHDQKNNLKNTLLLQDPGKPRWYAAPRLLLDPDRFVCDWFAVGLPETTELQLSEQLTDAAGNARQFPPLNLRSGSLVAYTGEYPLTAAADGAFSVTLRSADGTTGTVNSCKADRLGEQRRQCAALLQEFALLRERAAKLPESALLAMYDRVLARQLSLYQTELNRVVDPGEKQYILRRGEVILLPELAEALQRFSARVAALESGATLPENWTMQTSQQQLIDQWPQARMRSDRGNEELRPLFLGGYGHFPNGLAPDLEHFSTMGGNIIHLEIGPSAFFSQEGRDGEFTNPNYDYLRNVILPTIAKAKANNLRVLLLLSPHYTPSWWLEKYADAKASSGFLPFDMNHPEARRYIAAYLDVLLPELAASPDRDALHSICLTNEPTYTAADPARAVSQHYYAADLKQRFGTIEALNRECGRAYPNFDAAAQAATTDPVMNFLFERWRQSSFAQWHAEMAQQVRRYLPEVPIQSKIMVFFSLEPTMTRLGVDPEQFSEFSDLNGNDNYFFYREGAWVSDWTKVAFYHDLQWSFRPAAIVNGENHIIPDGDRRPVPYEHIYSATFQQYASGVSGVVTWLWDDLHWDNPSELHGNVSRRPIAVLAQGEATFNANRVAEELLTLRRTPAPVALLYSPTSYLRDPQHYAPEIRALHEQLCFTGYPVTFLSEKQLSEEKFGEAKVLLLPNAPHLDRQAWQGVKEFVRQGGKLLYTGQLPQLDQFDRPLPPIPGSSLLQFAKLPKADVTMLTQQLQQFLPKLQLQLSVDHSTGMLGIYRRSAPSPAGELTNLVNYNQEERRIKLITPPRTRAVDLISGAVLEPEFTLPVLTPLLVRLEATPR